MKVDLIPKIDSITIIFDGSQIVQVEGKIIFVAGGLRLNVKPRAYCYDIPLTAGDTANELRKKLFYEICNILDDAIKEIKSQETQ